MLKQAKIRNPSPLIQYVHASAEQLPVKENSAHCVTIAFGLRNVDNREKALLEFHRVLQKNGTLIVLDFFPAQNSLFKNLFNFYNDKNGSVHFTDHRKPMISAINNVSREMTAGEVYCR